MTVQVIADIATAIKESAAAGVAHRDVTPNNFGHIDGRGLLTTRQARSVQDLSVSSAGISPRTCGHSGTSPPAENIRQVAAGHSCALLSPALACMATAVGLQLKVT